MTERPRRITPEGEKLIQAIEEYKAAMVERGAHVIGNGQPCGICRTIEALERVVKVFEV